MLLMATRRADTLRASNGNPPESESGGRSFPAEGLRLLAEPANRKNLTKRQKKEES